MFFLRKSSLERLPVVMSGVRMGERALQIGVDDASLLGAIATKVGLSGHAAVVVADEKAAEKARRGAAAAGALVDVQIGTLDAFPFDDDAFDVVVVHAGGVTQPLGEARGIFRDSYRVLRAGGRLVVIEGGGLGFLGRPRQSAFSRAEPILAALEAAGFKSTRVLAEREGYRFLEGIKHQRGI